MGAMAWQFGTRPNLIDSKSQEIANANSKIMPLWATAPLDTTLTDQQLAEMQVQQVVDNKQGSPQKRIDVPPGLNMTPLQFPANHPLTYIKNKPFGTSGQASPDSAAQPAASSTNSSSGVVQGLPDIHNLLKRKRSTLPNLVEDSTSGSDVKSILGA